MANQEHLDLLKQGAKVWNQWREEHPDVIPDLRETNLCRSDLSGTNLQRVNLSKSNLSEVDFTGADLRNADLNGANLAAAYAGMSNFTRANLSQTSLQGIIFGGTQGYQGSAINPLSAGADNWSGVRLPPWYVEIQTIQISSAETSVTLVSSQYGTQLIEANLNAADLSDANFTRSNLSRADMSNARMARTILAGVDLSETKGLEAVYHSSPSYIGIDTIYRSGGNIPEAFLRGVGLSDTFITYVRSLISLPIDYYSCFISYSSSDEGFAKRLYADLQSQGVRCWFSPEDLKIGDHYHQRIDESIHLYDKLILILSEHSVQSAWVEREMVAAREKEDREQQPVLFPIRLDDAVMQTTKAWAADVRRRWHIGDFTQWKHHDAYQKVFERLLRDLKASV